MKIFAVTVERQVSQTHDLEIEAEDEDTAREVAEDQIPTIAPDAWDPGLEEDPEVIKVVELSDGDESEEEGDELEEEASTANS